ncbi:hypothetical protein [Legionella fairfieldensis]|uniref:hypothetical protein n=1 Tax=Legionella fairfieldensis TaxID=45064 RepID=UPI00104134F6|nr:hypothetical protein [Legionella fairfieldensis]
MTIRVLSFDFDGCLFNIDYLYSEEKDVIKSNEDFLTRIKQENLAFTKTYTLVGSNRQSKNSDMVNFLHRGSCFPAIKRISNFLGTTFDPFLLADVFGNLPSGTSYARAMAKNYREHKEWMFDETKVTIMYAQMHKRGLKSNGTKTYAKEFQYFQPAY